MSKVDKIQEFLLRFFKEDKYSERFINGYWLIKQWNGNQNRWQVAIYTEKSYENYKIWDLSEYEQMNHFKKGDYLCEIHNHWVPKGKSCGYC